MQDQPNEDLTEKVKELEASIKGKDQTIKSMEKEISNLKTYKQQVEENHNKDQQAKNQQANENRTSPIEIVVRDFFRTNTGRFRVEGEIRNISNMDLTSVRLRALFTDNQNNIIESKEFIATSGTLFPNALAQYSTLGPDDNRIERVTVEVVSFR